MDTRHHLQPGQDGTKMLVRKHGDKLVSVRYRYNAATCQRHKTVELIEESVPWHPRGSRETHLMQRAAEEPVLVRVDYNEWELRETIKQAGGHWNPDEKAWAMPYGIVTRLGLLHRIVGDI